MAASSSGASDVSLKGMLARNAMATQATRNDIQQLSRSGWYHSLELPDGTVIEGVVSIERLKWRIAQFPMAQDLTGKRVLDVGAWDGWFSFEMERRGAEVVAVDSTDQTRFPAARKLMGSKVEHVVEDICRLTPERVEYFDIVLFFGVLYHVKHPLLALERVCELCRADAYVESFVTDPSGDLAAVPAMEFYETTELRGKFDNWIGPNTACLMAPCRAAGFARVQLESVDQSRAHVSCFRQWRDEPGPGAGKPLILSIENSVTMDHRFSPARDGYMNIWIRTDEGRDLTRDNVYAQLGPFAARPVMVQKTTPVQWQVCVKVPLGLRAGWYDVTLRVGDSAWSNPLQIGVEVTAGEGQTPSSPTKSEELKIGEATDGKTWEPFTVRLGQESWISLWVHGLPDRARMEDVRVRLNGFDLQPAFLSPRDAQGRRQVNAKRPSGLKAGTAGVAVIFEDHKSRDVEVRLVREVE
ncbi:MAG TPA: class I SAM-dependent methyltransferase [Bryobacteraceae bacterium]|jgi:tRNA (mo5U34)-methyltransferase|nr:class I SAM-dependent methyltransferase [Bryobacteraceae bacterium]